MADLVDLTLDDDNEVIPIYDRGTTVTGDRLFAVHLEVAQVLAPDVNLKDQQARAIPWLVQREATDHLGCRGGFNFDAPGTGKTLVFACLTTLQLQRQPGQTTLVVLPSVVVAQVWLRELTQRMSPDYRPRVMLYHGSQRNRNFEAKEFDIVITTYGVLTSEHKSAIEGLGRHERNVVPLDDKSILFRNYYRLILDEAHQCRNAGTRLARAILALRGTVRWVISASPVFNSLGDLSMPLRFLGVRPYADGASEFKNDIMKLARRDRQAGLRRLHAVLAPIAIRRTNADLCLPPMRYKEVVLEPSETQKAFCDALRTYCGVRVKELLRLAEANRRPDAVAARRRSPSPGWLPNHNMHVLTLIMYARQAVCHPALVINSMKRLSAIRGVPDGEEEEREEVDKVTQDQMRRAIERLRVLSTDEGREDECCVCMDAEASLLASPCGHGCCAECWRKIEQHAGNADRPTCPMCRQVVVSTAPREELIQQLESQLAAPPASEAASEVWDSSCKVDYVLGKVKKHAPQEKIVIVSQWVRLLKIVSEKLLHDGVLREDQIVRLQGDVSSENRIDAINRFQNENNVRLCMLSLNSSSEGITLTSGTRMYVLDPWWNASRDYQAVHRIHRIGQTRPVKVTAVYVNRTVEDHIRIIRAAKGAIASATVGDNAPPEEFDWTKEARLIFDEPASLNHRRLPPTCTMPGMVANTMAQGFDSKWRKDVFREAESLKRGRISEKEPRRVFKRQKAEHEEKERMDESNINNGARVVQNAMTTTTTTTTWSGSLLPPKGDTRYTVALDQFNRLLDRDPCWANFMTPADLAALVGRRIEKLN